MSSPAALSPLSPLAPASTADRTFYPAMVMVLITRDAMEKIAKRVLGHELEILHAMYGEENITFLPHDPTMLPRTMVVDGERLEGHDAQMASLRRRISAAAEYGRLTQAYGAMPDSQETWVHHVFGASFHDQRFLAALQRAEDYDPVIQEVDWSVGALELHPLNYGAVRPKPGTQPYLDRIRADDPDSFVHGPQDAASTPAAGDEAKPPLTPLADMTKALIVGELTTRQVSFDPAATKADLADVLEEARAQADLDSEEVADPPAAA